MPHPSSASTGLKCIFLKIGELMNIRFDLKSNVSLPPSNSNISEAKGTLHFTHGYGPKLSFEVGKINVPLEDLKISWAEAGVDNFISDYEVLTANLTATEDISTE